jgi:hypothetical protein
MRLTELGMRSDEAFRYSQLAQDGEFRQKTLELQADGMRLDEAFRRAELDLRGELGRGELDIRQREADAQIQSMEVARFGVVADFVLRAIEAGISADQIEGAIEAFMGGDENAFSGITDGIDDPEQSEPRNHTGVIPPESANAGDTWTDPTTRVRYTYRDGRWTADDGTVYVWGTPPA